MNIYPTVNDDFLNKWSRKFLRNYGMTQDKGINAPSYSLLAEMLHEAGVTFADDVQHGSSKIPRPS